MVLETMNTNDKKNYMYKFKHIEERYICIWEKKCKSTPASHSHRVCVRVVFETKKLDLSA